MMELPMSLLEWHPHETASNTYMRRLRLSGSETRQMTRQELQEHFESGHSLVARELA
jgi:hypothetical protein